MRCMSRVKKRSERRCQSGRPARWTEAASCASSPEGNVHMSRNHARTSLFGRATLGLFSLAVASCSSSDGTSAPATSPVGAAQQTSSYEVSMDPIDVPPGGELYKCQDFTNPFGKDIAI